MKYYYFVSFNYHSDKGLGLGLANMVFDTDAKIRKVGDINKITERINMSGDDFKNVVILNINLLDSEES